MHTAVPAPKGQQFGIELQLISDRLLSIKACERKKPETGMELRGKGHWRKRGTGGKDVFEREQ